MKTSKKAWPLATVFGLRDSINTNPDYQRPPVWTRSQKQLLIDTILRNYELYYFHHDRTEVRLVTLAVAPGAVVRSLNGLTDNVAIASE